MYLADLLTAASSPVVPLPLEDEIALIENAQRGDEAAYEALVAQYAPALRAATRRFRELLGEDEAQSVAFLAFAETIAAHDPERSPRLAGALRPALSRALMDAATPGQLAVSPRRARQYVSCMGRAGGDVAKATALALEAGMTRETFADLHRALDVTSYDATVGVGRVGLRATADARVWDARRASDVSVTAPPRSLTEEAADLVDVALGAVDGLEEKIVRLYYGFEEYDNVPDAEVAHRLGLTRPTVQRRREGALGKMRSALGLA